MIRKIIARHLHRHIDQSLILPPRVDTSYVSRGARNESESAERERERERPPYPRFLAGSFERIAEYRQLRARGIASGSGRDRCRRRHRTRRYSATRYSPAPNKGKASPGPRPLPLFPSSPTLASRLSRCAAAARMGRDDRHRWTFGSMIRFDVG